MESLVVAVTAVGVILTWFVFSIASTFMFLRTKNLKQFFHTEEVHWAMKFVIGYGIAYAVAMVVLVSLGFVVFLGLILWRGLFV